MPPWEVVQAPGVWVRKMTHWLPYHRDRLVLLLARAIATALSGTFKPEFQEDPETQRPKDPETVRAAANRGLDAFSRRADAAMRAYQQKKSQGRA